MRRRWSEPRGLRRRRDVAGAFDTVIEDALRPRRGCTARAPVAAREVLDAQAELEQLIAHLRDRDRPVDAAALALAEEVLCDVDGPLFAPGPAGALRRRVRLVRIALE